MSADPHPAAAVDPARRPSAPAQPDDIPGAPESRTWWLVGGLLLVVALGALTRVLEQNVPVWAEGTSFASVVEGIEFPVYAIALGLLGNGVLVLVGLRDRFAAAFRTEFFIKTGVVLLGASVNLSLIDTTAAVAAAGALAGDDVLALATIVKTTQNALIGVVAIALTAYFTLRVERTADAPRLGAGEIWRRFPKFVLGFLVASVAATLYVAQVGSDVAKPVIGVANDLRTLFFILAFVSIGLGFTARSLRDAGWRPVLVFGAATVFNLVVGLLLASVLFRGFTL